MGEKIMDGFPSKEEALADFFAAWTPKREIEYVTLDEAVDRVLAQDVFARFNLPVYRSSSCDGIAVKSAAFQYGLPDTSTWKLGVDYVRADTGDDFPDEFDAIIMIEKAAIQPDGSVILDDDVKVSPNSGVILAGSTLKRGTLVLHAKTLIRPTDLAALAMGGATVVPVQRKPRIAFIPTGSELVPAGIAPRRGQNIDANSLMVKHTLKKFGAEPLIFPIVYDNFSDLECAFQCALTHADAVIINGGSALGEEDCNVKMIEKRGTIIHHYIAAVPGRPLMMAVVDNKPVVVLPGPTLASYYGTEWCLQAITARFLGIPVHQHPRVIARADATQKSIAKMANIGRVDITRTQTGYSAHFYNFKAGELVRCMTSNAQRISPIGEAGWDEGDELEVELLRGEEFIKDAD